ncbi:MAG TPA: PAS domain S-box protein, partial [Chloroflexota bacterium]|nr:PAS domain S-box protein [Chloroflexota bacterium]
MQDEDKTRRQLIDELTALRESERRLREMVNLLPETVFEMDLSYRLTFSNRAGLDRFGCTQEDIDNKLFMPLLLAPESRETAKRAISAVFQGKRGETTEFTALRPDGTPFPIRVYASPIIQDGKPVGLRGFLVDISSEKQTEQALRESEERYRALVDAIDDVVQIKDARGRYQMVNAEMCRRVEMSKEELVGKTAVDIYPMDVALKIVENDRHVIETGLPIESEEEHHYPHFRISYARKVPIRDETGKVTGLVTVSRDITERRQLEEQLLRAQRLETAGRIAGQVAHDFNNLLAPMTAYPELIKLQLPKDHPAVQYCDAMLEAADRMAAINEDMMALGRRGHFEQQPVDLNLLVEQALAQMPAVPATLTVHLDFRPNLPPAGGSPAQLQRVVSNLISNAREAMEDDGILTIHTDRVQVANPMGNYSRIEPGDYVTLRISDTGCGIPENIGDKVFDAFFTTKTKTRRRGCGLGLSIVQSIVADHHGFVDMESEVGRGTSFEVYLPVCLDNPKEKPTQPLRGGTEAILVVDDDELQRDVVTQMLQKVGYRVQSVASGEAAIARLHGHKADLLVLDMIMPQGIDGTETYRRILERHPGQRAIVLSGFSESERVREAQKLGAGAYLRKPVTMERLAMAV